MRQQFDVTCSRSASCEASPRKLRHTTQRETPAEVEGAKMNTITRKFAWRLIAGFATVLAWAASAAAQTVVVGTGNPDIDVPAVQAAVDQGGDVILQGHFSFDRPPTVPRAVGGKLATVLISRAVAISGAWDEQDEDGEMTTIEGGTDPFYVQAPGASVEIRRLRFINPTADAIFVYAVSGLVIASCKIEGVLNAFGAIRIATTAPNLPTPTNPGKPENISGTLVVANNDIDVGGTASDATLGILIWSVGVPGAEVDAYVSGNTIRNVTERGVYLSRAVGRMYVEGNVITTGTVSGPVPPIGIFAINLGSHVIAHNRVHAQWATGEAWGIVVQSGAVAWPIIGALVVDNDVSMEAPEGTIFGARSAAIDIRGIGGAAQDNVVLNNRIRGRARAALAVELGAVTGSAAANNAFVLNRFDDFEPSIGDIFVGAGAMNTLIVGGGTVEDLGVGTIIVPLPPKGDHDQDRQD
jgi:hypothetical protein